LPAAITLTVADLDQRGLDRVVLVGHSAGAELAMHVAASKPHRVVALVLAAPVVGGGPPPFVRRFAGAPVVRDVGPALLRAGVKLGLRRALAQTWANRDRVTDDVVAGYRAPLMEPGAAEGLWAMTAHYEELAPDWDALGSMPTLVVKGDRDKWTTLVPLPDAAVLEYPNCGHLPHEEQPERFVADVLSFVNPLA
jgi:pimeloyl-ACP methyl ester carboxylesterase